MNKHIFQDITDVLLQFFSNRLRAIILFGSHARGTAKPDSDYDLYLIIKDLPKNPIERQKLIRASMREIPLRISTISRTPEEITCNLTPMMLDLCIDGLCLYGEEYFEPLRKRVLELLKISGLERKKIDKAMYWTFKNIPKKEWELNWDGFHEL